tara:strand:+ start:36925 stop:38622 length:1698 start_codon:yes stop_codon:yes gene_type:complete
MVTTILVACIGVGGIMFGADRPSGVDRVSSGRSAVLARNGMVATSQPLAAQAGLQILRQGGNAFDAAVATAAVLSVVEPMMTGPGGDLFVIAHVARTGKLVGLNASGFSPQNANPAFFSQQGLDRIPIAGPLSVTVPGAVDGWITLLEKHGTMTREQVFAPAIDYAEKGFAVSEIIASSWKVPALEGITPQADRIADDFKAAYYVDGRKPEHGDVFTNKALAGTLRRIVNDGAEVFYEGEIARQIVDHLNSLGWPITMEDMSYQHADWVEPISTTYRGQRIFELPPNGQGMAALEMLNILEGYDLRSLGHNSAAYLHRLIEAKKLAFADLDAWLADPEKADLPVDKIISKEYGHAQRRRINLNRAADEVRSGVNDATHRLVDTGDTIYLTVVDKDRNMVSFINSIFHAFGSGVVVPGTGVILQNRGALFSLTPEHPNQIQPRKRPYHTIIPAMAYKEGKPWLSFGVMGGSMQPQGHVQILLNMIDFGMNVQDAGEMARVRHSSGKEIILESGISKEAVIKLKQLGHQINPAGGGFGGYQAIEVDWKRGVLRGGSDPRKDGHVAAW